MRPYYDQDGVTIYHGDCREIAPTLVRADILITDPPYGTEGLAGGYGRGKRTIENDSDLGVWQDFWQAYRPGFDGWALVFFAAGREEHMARCTRGEWRGTLCWDKGRPGLGYTIRYNHEQIAVFECGDAPRPTEAILSVLRYAPSTFSAHPHAKPVPLLRHLVRWAPGEIALDPFAGSGSTLVAAKVEGRRCVGIEADERYCEMAALRLGKMPTAAQYAEAGMFPFKAPTHAEVA